MSFTSARRDLWLVVSAKAISLLGDEVAAVALVLRLQSHGSGPSAVAGLLIAALLPVLLLAGIAGRLVDRYDSRALLVTSSLAQAAVCAVLASTTGTPAILALVALLGAGQSINGATWQSLLPAIAGPHELPRAVGMAQAGSTLASIAAPAIGGLLTGWYGARVPLLVDAVTFIAITVAGLLLGTRRPAGAYQPPGAHESSAQGGGPVRAGGLRIVRTDPLLRLVFSLLALFVLLGAMVNVVEVFLVRETLHASTTWYGIVGASMGLGLLAGAVLGGRKRGELALARMFVGAAATLAAGLAAMSIVPSVELALPAAAVVGIGNGMLNVALSSLVMGRAAPEARGRVGAVLNGVASATQLGAYALGALLAVVLTPREIFALAGACGLLPSMIFGRALVRVATSTTTPTEPAAVPA